LLDLTAQYREIREEIDGAIRQVVESQAFVLGPTVQALEEALAAHLGVRHAVGVSSGTDALLVALWALGIGPGDLVVVPTYSFFATAGVVVRLGARPLFVDIESRTYNLDPKALESMLGEMTEDTRRRVKAIVPVHLFGQCADMDALLRVANAHGISVVEDAAQAIGARWSDGRAAGSMGALGGFSFFPSKNLGAFGDAGLVVTDDARLAEEVRLLRGHGASPKYHHRVVGGNLRLDALQAAVLLAKLPYLDRWTDARRARAERYDRWLAERGLVGNGVEPPAAVHRTTGLSRDHIYNQYVIRATGRDELRAFLMQEGIETAVYYPLPFHLQPCFADLGYHRGDFPEAERAARETLALPVYPELSVEQQTYVVDRIRAFYGKG
jgi:dTDP-4-amino-4,6-dideoxygalactose transaminase